MTIPSLTSFVDTGHQYRYLMVVMVSVLRVRFVRHLFLATLDIYVLFFKTTWTEFIEKEEGSRS